MTEDEGFMWINSSKLPTEHTISEFPHVIIADNNKDKTIMWSDREVDFERNVVFDGRKEEKMTEVKKYKVTKEFMDKLVEWRDKYDLDATNDDYSYLALSDFNKLPSVVNIWWVYGHGAMERNNRLIAIISWLNGDDSIFEALQPHKFIIRSEKPNWDGEYWYVIFREGMANTTTYLSKATKFSTREEAQEWANSHQVVIEVDAEG